MWRRWSRPTAGRLVAVRHSRHASTRPTAAASAATAELRPYQRECVETCLDLYVNYGVRRQVVSLPVGTGKTVCFWRP